jgi:hypothetical protein
MGEPEQTDGLRLQVRDAEDLQILSSLLQDALIAAADMHYDEAGKAFFLVCNRFCWEKPPLAGLSDQPAPIYARAMCGVRVGAVTKVRRKGFAADQKTAGFYNLLSISYENNAGKLDWVFSGVARVQMQIDRLEIVLADLGPDHPAFAKPGHDSPAG